jgi:hypothetical protein
VAHRDAKGLNVSSNGANDDEREVRDEGRAEATARPEVGGRYSVRGIAGYLALWGVDFTLIKVLIDYSSIGAEGAYPISAAWVTDLVLPLVIGLTGVALSIPLVMWFGRPGRALPFALGTFVAGSLAIPTLVVLVTIAAGLGLIDVD